MDLTEVRLLPRRGSGLQVHPIRASCLLSLLVMPSSIDVRMQEAGQAWKEPSSPLWELCCCLCDPVCVRVSGVTLPRESPHRWGSLGQLLLTPAHNSHPEGTLCPNSSICLCILPGFKLAFVPIPLGHKALRARQWFVYLLPPIFPSDVTLALRAQLLRQRDGVCSKASLLHVGDRLWTIDLDSLCLGFYTFKAGIIIKLIYGGLLWGVNIQ